MFPVFSKAIKKARSVGRPVDPNDDTKGYYAPSSLKPRTSICSIDLTLWCGGISSV